MMDPDCLYCKNKGSTCASHIDDEEQRRAFNRPLTQKELDRGHSSPHNPRPTMGLGYYEWLEDDYPVKHATTEVITKRIRSPFVVKDDADD